MTRRVTAAWWLLAAIAVWACDSSSDDGDGGDGGAGGGGQPGQGV